MKSKIYTFLFALFLLCLINETWAQDASSYIQKHLIAIGGEEKWTKIKSLQIETTTENEGVIISSKVHFQYHKNYRQDIHYMGRTVSDTSKSYFILVNETKGWKYLPDNLKPKVLSLDSSEINLYIHTSELDDPFVQATQNETRIIFINEEFFNNKNYIKLLIQYKSNKQEYCYLDPETWLIFMRTTINSASEDMRTYLEYQKHKDGYLFPKKVNTAEGTKTYNTITVNPTFKKDQFKVPISSGINSKE
jgi:hypothetical protein